jgi:hypothetical protein
MQASWFAMISGASGSGAGRPMTHAKRVLTPFHSEATVVVFPDGTNASSKLNVPR